MGALLSTLSRAAFGRASGEMGGVFSRLTTWLTGRMSGMVLRVAGLFGQLPGLILGGLARLSGGVLGALGAMARALSGVLGVAFKGAVYGAVGAVGALVGAVGGLAALALRAAQGVSAWSQGARSLAGSTGMSGGAAGMLSNRLRINGIDAEESFGGQNPELFRQRAAMYGVPGYDSPGFLPAAAQRFQGLNAQGLTGQLLAQQFARALGLNTPAGFRALTSPTSQLRENQGFASRVDRGLGLDSSALVRLGRNWDSFVSRISYFGNSVLARIAQAALPRLNAGLEALSAFMERSAGGIGGFIERAVDGAFNGLIRIADFLWKELPEAGLSFVSTILQGLGAVSSAAPSMFQGLLKLIDIVQAVGTPVFEWLQGAIPNVFQMIGSGVGAIGAAVAEFRAQLPVLSAAISDLFRNIASHPLVSSVLKLTGAAASSAGGGGSNPIADVATDVGVGGVFARLWKGIMARAATSAAAGPTGSAAFVNPGLSGIGLKAAAFGSRVLGAVSAPVVGAGIAAGGLGYSVLQRMGVLGNDAPGLGEAAGNTWTRIRNLLTLNDYNANVTQSGGPTGRGTSPTDRIRTSLDAILDAGRRGYASPSSALPNLFNPPRGTWSREAQRRFEPLVMSGSASASEAIQGALAAVQQAQKDVAGRGSMEEYFKELVRTNHEIARNTKEAPTGHDMQAYHEAMIRTVAMIMEGRGDGEWLGLFKH